MTSVLALSSPQAFAQDSDSNDEIIVTGSRLNVNPNLTAANPVLSVSGAEISKRGIVNIEDLTNSIPSIAAGQTAEVSNGATGTSQINLRGLGAVRTLTLIDGRRLPYGDSASTAINADLIPTNLVERVEVLTGGSSAVYGSDAVAGVVNFILKDDFEGFEADIQYGFAQSSNNRPLFEAVLEAAEQPIPGATTDGEEITGSITFGANLDNGRGNVVGYASYQSRNEIVQDDRIGSACEIDAGAPGPSSVAGFVCFGSSNFRRFNNVAAFGATDVFLQENGQFTPFAGGPAETFNFGPFNFFSRPSERVQLYTKATYEIFDNHELFADFGYTQTISDAQIAPTASFGFFDRSINCDNPFLQDPTVSGQSFAQAVLQCTPQQIADGDIISGITASHRNVEGDPRNSRLENSSFRFVGGARGTFAENFEYEVFGQYSESSDEDTSTNDFIIDNLDQALQVVEVGGQNVCLVNTEVNAAGVRVLGGAGNDCVPFNIFQRGPNGESLVTQEALDFIQGVGITTGQTDQLVLGGHVQTDLSNYGIVSPFAPDTGVGLLVGVEYREDGLEATPDQISQQPDGGFTGVGGPTLPVAGTLDVIEFFGELELPLITDVPFIEELVFNGQYRYSDYGVEGNGVTNDFTTNTFGLQLTWRPTSDVSFRGQFQRAVRAPNVIELFTGQATGLDDLPQVGNTGIFDPCSTANPVETLARCANTGVTPALFGNIPDIVAGQTQVITGGNPNLSPESSDTFTVGAVFTPEFPGGLTASVDYFDITIDDAIGALSAPVILDNCLETGSAQFCDLIVRDAAGSLIGGGQGTGFITTNVNIASNQVRGFDFQLDYGFDFGDLGLGNFGDVALTYASTVLVSDNSTPFAGADRDECAGEFLGNCGQPNPAYRHRALATWNTPVEGLGVNVTWRHFGAVDNDSSAPADVEQTINAADYFDVSTEWEFLDGISARVGVNNIFEHDFPVLVSAGPGNNGNGNTIPGIYDTGRFIFMGLNVKL